MNFYIILALELTPNDPKALFRRCQAFESLSKYEEAYKDVIEIRQIDPRNKAIQPILQRLNPIIQAKVSIVAIVYVNFLCHAWRRIIDYKCIKNTCNLKNMNI